MRQEKSRSNKSFKVVTVCALCVAVLCLAVAYAALSQTLTIRGSAKVVSATWDVHFESFDTKTTGAGEITHSSQDKSTAISNLHVTLTKPGDSGMLKFKIHNNGQVNSILTTLGGKDTPLSCEGSATDPEKKTADEKLVCDNVVYEFKYDTNKNGEADAEDKDVAEGDLLNATDQHDGEALEEAYIKVTYKSTANDIPSDSVTVTGLDRDLTYTQNFSS